MASGGEYCELVRKARLGDREAMERLSRLATEYLRAYVYRLTLDEALAADIAQESMLEMVRFLEKLEDDGRFWPWLRRIANGKLYKHAAREQQARATHGKAGQVRASDDRKDGFADLVSTELKQIVTESMAALAPRHRQVLILRCYEGLSFRQIAQEMECTQIGARMLFMRSKNASLSSLAAVRCGKERFFLR